MTRFAILTSLFVITVSKYLLAQGALTNSIGMEFVLIKPGSMIVGEFQPPYPVPDDTVKNLAHSYVMWMGDGRSYNAGEFWLAKEMATHDARPGFKVSVEKQFYIGKYEVTQREWNKVMGDNPSTFKNEKDSDDRPVENITWADAHKFIRALNKLENRKCYRLPTEFEWEYAARAGREKDIPWPEIQTMANLNKSTTEPVGQRKPNAWGLYDMLGNVWEWTADYYNEKIFADEKPPTKGSQHVLKGASFVGDVKNATYMTHAAGPGNGWDVGFRIVMIVEKK
jgi:formylglycine-generating enzyme